jgi:hypothetical protein
MNWYKRHTAFATFVGMFFWWAAIVLYFSQRWEGVGVYLVGLFPALPLCLVLGWGIDRVGIIKSWRGRAAIGYGLNWLAQMMWASSTHAECIARGIHFGTDGPFVLGAMAVTWVNLLLLMIIVFKLDSFKKKDNLSNVPR